MPVCLPTRGAPAIKELQCRDAWRPAEEFSPRGSSQTLSCGEKQTGGPFVVTEDNSNAEDNTI
jgi:hypothetical protein